MATVPLTQYAVHLRPQDNIAVASKPIPAGASLSFEGGTVTVPAAIKMGHKFAVVPIKEGDAVLKFGFKPGMCWSSGPAAPKAAQCYRLGRSGDLSNW